MANKYYDMGAIQAFYNKIKTIFQTVSNKVTSWNSTPSDDKYPSEKLVKDSLDAKAPNAPSEVTIANGDKIVITDASDSNKVKRASIAFDGSTVGTLLSKKGTFEYPYDEYLAWGGRNRTGSFGVIDAALITELGANRFAGGKAAGITIEYTRDGGTTWIDYGATDLDKRNIFTNKSSKITLGKCDSTNRATTEENYANYKTRVIINCEEFGIYNEFQKFVFYISTNGSNQCYMIMSAVARAETSDVWTTIGEMQLSGCTGFNVYNKSISIGKSASNATYKKICITFESRAKGDANYSGMEIYSIWGYGGVGWTVPSTLAGNGTVYSVNGNLETTFPSKITAPSFVGVATSSTSASKTYSARWSKADDGSNLDRPIGLAWNSVSSTWSTGGEWYASTTYDSAFTYNSNTNTLKSPNISAGTFSGNLSGSATSALTSKSALSAGSAAKAAALSNTAYKVASSTSATNADRWTTPRTIGASGDITWSVVTNGSANVTSAASINNVPWSAISSYAAAVDTSTTNKFTTPKAVNDAITGAMTTKASFKGPYTAKSNIPAGDLDHLSIFLVGPTGTGDDKYEEYILPATGTTTAHLLQIGDTTTDLSNYALKNSSYGSLSAGYASSTNTAQTMKSAMSAATASYAVSAGAAPVASHNHNYKLSGAGTALDVSAGINLKPNGNIAISTAANTINISAKDTTYTSLNSINSTQYNALTSVSGVKDIKNYAAISAISGTTSKGSFAPSNSADTFTLIAGNNIDFVSGANSLTISSKSYSIPTVYDKQIKITTGTSPSTGSFTTNQSTTGQIVLGSMALASTSDYSLTSHNHNYTLSGNGTAVNVSAGVNFKPSGSNIKFYVSGNDIYISAKNDNSTAYIPSGFQVSAINGTTTGVYYLSAFKLNAGTNIGFTSASNSQITITAKDTTYTSLNGINSTEYNVLTSTSANSRNPNAHQLSSHTNFSTYFNGTSANSALTSKSALSAGSAAKAVSASGANSASFALSSNTARNGNFFEDSVGGCPASHNSGSTYAVGATVSTSNSAFSASAAVPTGAWTSVSSKFARLSQVTWTITDSTITGLYKGLQLWIKVPCYGGSSGSNATMLSINGSASKQVRYNNSNYTTHYASGTFIHLTYDGSYFQIGDRDTTTNAAAQQRLTANSAFPILFKPSATTANLTAATRFHENLTYNPNINQINACSGFNINYQSATNPNKNILFLGSDNVANNLQSFVDSKLVISEKSKLSDTSTTVNNDVFAVKGGGTIYSQALDVYANYTPTQTTSTVKFNYKPDHTSPTGTRWTDIRTFKDTDAGSYYQPFLVMSQNGMLMPTDVKIISGGYGSPYYDCLITKSMTAETAYYTNLTSPYFSAANVSAANISATSVTGLNFVADNNNILKFSTSLYQIILTGGIQNMKPLLQFHDNSNAEINYTLGNAADYWGGQTYDYGGNIDKDVACGIKNIYYFIRTSTTTAKIAFSSFNANKNKVFSFITSNTGTAGYKQIESSGWQNKNVSIKNHIGTSANMSVDKLIINIGTTANNVTGSQGQYTINISAKKANVSLMPNGSNSYWLIVDDS